MADDKVKMDVERNKGILKSVAPTVGHSAADSPAIKTSGDGQQATLPGDALARSVRRSARLRGHQNSSVPENTVSDKDEEMVDESKSNEEPTGRTNEEKTKENQVDEIKAKEVLPDEEMKDGDAEQDSTSEEKSEDSKRKKRQMNGEGQTPRKRRKKVHGPLQPKNALMQLNELKPGLHYVVESQEGPPHDPVFVVSVTVNEEKFVGRGHSKQLAKHAAAQAALASFVQFRNMPEAMNAISKHITNADFTSDNVENEAAIFNRFEQRKNGSGDTDMKLVLEGEQLEKKAAKAITEIDKKNPVMLLNEIHPGLEFTLIKENSSVPSQRFCMTVTVGGEQFEGTGPNKKMAKASAARAVLCKLYNVNYTMYPFVPSPTGGSDAELFNFPQPVADKIAKSIQDMFNEIMTENPEYAKWKVLAGITMTKDPDMEDVQVISIGTGTKCINGEHISMNGATLNDCHAEIISRRCLKDFFYTQLELHIEGEADQSIFMKKDDGGFCLRPHIKFHLFISTSPCGDARIFSPHEKGLSDPVDRHPNRKARGMLRTKIESGEGTIPVKPRQNVQTWDGILQGQQRLLTMSCSDKIASWNILGLQGALLTHFVEPIYLDSIILGSLFHPSHMQRAMCGRIENTLGELPKLYRLNKHKMCGTTSSETRHLVKSPNFSINWTTGLGRPEIVNASTGKTENGQVSRLAKRSFFQRFSNIYGHVSSFTNQEGPQPHLYATVKNAVTDYQKTKEQISKAFQEAGLGAWVKKPVEQDEFELIF